ncbi:MAG: long-chain fatty acid--CoA ligase [Lachnospiraceae bacterium]|nr:long-chain fatty acid--CoA ligase [Lachnospiraceae bacterium]
MGKVYIRSQDRESLYCFGGSYNALCYSNDTVHRKGAKEPAVRHSICISDGCLETLGEYETKERCLAILDEIQQKFSSYYNPSGGGNISTFLFDMPKVYQMPEK